MEGIKLITEERIRQIEKEGWSKEHDAELSDNCLANAAICYAIESNSNKLNYEKEVVADFWPFDKEWWKPKDRIRNLVRAGALIAAQIDKITNDK